MEIDSFLQYKKYLPIDNLMLCCRAYANRSQRNFKVKPIGKQVAKEVFEVPAGTYTFLVKLQP